MQTARRPRDERVIELDHVLIAVTDLAAAGREFQSRYGLVSITGGRHPGWGTANRIVPLGDTYLELIAVADEAAAAASPFGRWVARAAAAEPRPLGWAVRTDDLDAVAARLALEVVPGQRLRPDGEPVRWRLAGVEHAAAEHAAAERAAAEAPLPFFIEWEAGTLLPGQ